MRWRDQRLTEADPTRDRAGQLRRGAARVDGGARALGIRKGTGRPPPRLGLPLGVAFAGLAGYTTFRPWISVDPSNSTERLPTLTSSGIAQLGFLHYSPHELFGLGTLLLGAVLAALALFIVACVRRARIWMLFASALFSTTAAAGGLTLTAMIAIESLATWLLPDAWESHSPEITVESSAPSFIGLNLALAVLSLWIWRRMRKPTAATSPA